MKVHFIINLIEINYIGVGGGGGFTGERLSCLLSSYPEIVMQKLTPPTPRVNQKKYFLEQQKQ